MNFDTQTIIGVLGAMLLAGSFIPYIRDILKKKTHPHIYTWFIWSITQCIAAIVILEGNGGVLAATTIASGAVLSIVVFFLSLKQGTKHITRFDTITLGIAFMAGVSWWLLHTPLIGVIAVALIDGIGFLPTYRKTWKHPHSESITAWTLFVAGNLCALITLEEFNLLTTLYIATVTVASFLLIILSIYRRKGKL